MSDLVVVILLYTFECCVQTSAGTPSLIQAIKRTTVIAGTPKQQGPETPRMSGTIGTQETTERHEKQETAAGNRDIKRHQ